MPLTETCPFTYHEEFRLWDKLNGPEDFIGLYFAFGFTEEDKECLSYAAKSKLESALKAMKDIGINNPSVVFVYENRVMYIIHSQEGENEIDFSALNREKEIQTGGYGVVGDYGYKLDGLKVSVKGCEFKSLNST